jgi:hypothetical protein
MPKVGSRARSQHCRTAGSEARSAVAGRCFGRGKQGPSRCARVVTNARSTKKRNNAAEGAATARAPRPACRNRRNAAAKQAPPRKGHGGRRRGRRKADPGRTRTAPTRAASYPTTVGEEIGRNALVAGSGGMHWRTRQPQSWLPFNCLHGT